MGVNLSNDNTGTVIHDSFLANVWEPEIVRLNAIEAAAEAACMILSVDETIKSPKKDHSLPSNQPSAYRGGGMPGMGRPM